MDDSDRAGFYRDGETKRRFWNHGEAATERRRRYTCRLNREDTFHGSLLKLPSVTFFFHSFLYYYYYYIIFIKKELNFN